MIAESTIAFPTTTRRFKPKQINRRHSMPPTFPRCATHNYLLPKITIEKKKQHKRNQKKRQRSQLPPSIYAKAKVGQLAERREVLIRRRNQLSANILQSPSILTTAINILNTTTQQSTINTNENEALRLDSDVDFNGG